MEREHAEQPSQDPLSTGHQALAQGAWEEARVSFESALSQEETPEGFEGLGAATARLGDLRAAVAARECAYQLYQERGDRCAAAWMAIWLAVDCHALGHGPQASHIWLEQAHQLLEGLEPLPEHGWLALAEGQFALELDANPAAAERLGAEAAALGRRFGLTGLETEGLSLEQRARVSAWEAATGEPARGTLDEVVVMSTPRPPGARPWPRVQHGKALITGLVAALGVVCLLLFSIATGRVLQQTGATTANTPVSRTDANPSPTLSPELANTLAESAASPTVTQPTPSVPASTVSPVMAQPSPIAPTPSPMVLAPPPTASFASPSPVLSALPGALRSLLDERFVDNQQGWPSDRLMTAWLAADGYHLFARQPGQFVAVGAPLTEAPADVVVTAKFRKIGGPPGGGYGVIVRDQGPGPRDGLNQGGRYYVLEAGDRGEVGIWRREGDRWVDLVSWQPSTAVRPGGATNEVQVQALGPRLVLSVNGTEAVTATDSVLDAGRIGIFVGGDLNEVVLERFQVQVPE